MGVRIAGQWDIWGQPETEFTVQWRFLAEFFRVERLYMIPRTGMEMLGYTSAILDERDSLTDVINDAHGFVPVVVDERGVTLLEDFEHPTPVLYIFGRTGRSALEQLQWSGASIRIPAPNWEAYGLLQPAQAAAIVLYDRMRKSWPSR